MISQLCNVNKYILQIIPHTLNTGVIGLLELLFSRVLVVAEDKKIPL